MGAVRMLLVGGMLLAALCLPASAAARVQVAAAPGIDGLSLAGTGVAFSVPNEPNLILVHRAGPAGHARSARLRGFFDVEDFDASASHVALAVEPGYRDAPEYGEPLPLFGMRLSGPGGRSFAGCGSFPKVAVDGSAVAYSCSADTSVTIRDLATGESSTIPTGPSTLGLDMAGNFVAVERSLGGTVEIAVFDRTTGARVYTASAGDAERPFSLQPDGKLAALEYVDSSLECGMRVFWHSPANPIGGTVASDACGTEVEMADDQIAYQRAGGGELAVADLAGNSRVVALFPVRRALRSLSTLREFDFEGGLAAYAERGCGHDAVYMETASAPSPVAPGATSCPTKLLTRRARLRGRVITLRFRCPRGCSMLVDMVLRGRRGAYLRPDESYSLAPGESKLRIRLSGSELRSVRGLRSTTLSFSAQVRRDRLTQTERSLRRTIRVRVR